jgi:hypothetical protein
MYIQSSPVEVQSQARLEPDRPHYGRLAACIVAQQYSSATFVSLRFCHRKEEFDSHMKIFFLNCFFLFKKLLKPEIA